MSPGVWNGAVFCDVVYGVLKVAKSVSGKTTLLIASGLLDDGREVSTSAKYRHAEEKKVGNRVRGWGDECEVALPSF